ncbi:MAG: polysaccharide deacetylase family protein [Acidobacteriota bacterium]
MPQPVITPLRVAGRGPRVLTIDAEDWFHVCGDGYYEDPRRWDSFAPRIETTLATLFSLLEHGSHRATIFFLGWIARRYPGLVQEAVRRGHEVGVHGDVHRRADEMTPAEFRADLSRARDAIEGASGVPATVYRAAEWSIRHAGSPALAELARAGFCCDASTMPVPPLGSGDNPVGPHRIDHDGWSVTEIPPLTGRAFGRRLPLGGAWPFRVLSQQRLAGAEARARDRGEPAVFTVHPWEFDTAHPSMDGLPALTRAVHFVGLTGLSGRFTAWLARDRCSAIGDVLPRLKPA